MKTFLKILILSFAMIGVACTEGNAPVPGIELSSSQNTNFEFAPDGDTETVKFTSLLDWHVELPGGGEWLKVTPMEGLSGNAKITIKAEANLTSASRSAEVIICSQDLKVPISVVQDKYVPVFELVKDEYSVSAAGGELVVKVYTDQEYTCESSEAWIKFVDTKGAMTYSSAFVVEPNPEEKERAAVLTFRYDDKVLTCDVVQRPAGTEADDWKYEEFVQRSLAMRFTADWCQYCPYMATAFDTAKSNLYGSLEVVSIHGDGGLVFSSANSLMSRFGVQGFPSGIVDARVSIPNFSDPNATAQKTVEVVKELQDATSPLTGIAVKSNLVASELRVDLTVYAKKANVYRVTAILLEDNITAYQAGVSNPNSYVHNGVARAAITPISGDRIEIGEGGGIWTADYEVKVPSKCNRDNLRILVYVEKPYVEGEQVCKVEYVDYYNFGDRYLDNCRSVPIKTDNDVEFE